MKSLLRSLWKPANASVEAFRKIMGSLTWFLPISKNRNLETVAACSGDPSWFDSMIQALGSLQPQTSSFMCNSSMVGVVMVRFH